MKKVQYDIIRCQSSGFYLFLAAVAAVIAIGLGAAYYMEHHGHHVTGMNNQIVWGMPHVFAIFLIVAASGALNVASISSVFSKAIYKPLARLSALLAITLLLGGLIILVLDLGHPDRLIVAMTKYNFKSIFAWNMILYNGFLLIVGVYLWFMMERRMQRYYKSAGFAAFLWRLILTTGTGSIFGFLVARQAYDAAILAPTFIIMSFAFGLAVFILFLVFTYRCLGWPLGNTVIRHLKNLLGVFIGAVLYFSLVYHLANLYIAEHSGFERFILLEGGVYPMLFWGGHVIAGGLAPLLFLFHPAFGKTESGVVLASVLVILGAFAQLYVIIIGGQAYPLDIFPGYEVTASSFFDGAAMHVYTPSLWEFLLGLGGVAMVILMTVFSLKILPFLPTSLADKDVDPHHRNEKAQENSA